MGDVSGTDPRIEMLARWSSGQYRNWSWDHPSHEGDRVALRADAKDFLEELEAAAPARQALAAIRQRANDEIERMSAMSLTSYGEGELDTWDEVAALLSGVLGEAQQDARPKCLCGFSDPVYQAPEVHRADCPYGTAALLRKAQQDRSSNDG